MLGGNDAELTNILNMCVFMWAVINSHQLTAIELDRLMQETHFDWAGDFDFTPLACSCEEQLKLTEMIVESNDFSTKLDRVVTTARLKLAPGYVPLLFLPSTTQKLTRRYY
jgi:hypothetical protein